MITITTEEPERKRTNTWELYWFHASDPDASYRADDETLAKAGYVRASELEGAEATLEKVVDGYRQLAEYFQQCADCMTVHETIAKKCHEDARDMAQASLEEFTPYLSAPQPPAKTLAGCPGGDTENMDHSPTERHSGKLGTRPGHFSGDSGRLPAEAEGSYQCSFCGESWPNANDDKFFVFRGPEGVHICEWCTSLAISAAAERRLPQAQPSATTSLEPDSCHKCGGVAHVNDGDSPANQAEFARAGRDGAEQPENTCARKRIPHSAATHECRLPADHAGECEWSVIEQPGASGERRNPHSGSSFSSAFTPDEWAEVQQAAKAKAEQGDVQWQEAMAETESALDRFLKEPHAPSEAVLYDAIRWLLAGCRCLRRRA